MRKITKMTNDEAMKFFMKSNSYSNIDLPIYFNFQPILDNIFSKVSGKQISDFYKNKRTNPPSKFEDINYKFLNNKDGKYAWRPFELIHPVLYIDLAQEICESENWKIILKRFKDFQKNKKILCCSIPGESKSKKYDKKATILNWWNEYEQKSISLSLDYSYMAVTDISNCYASIYTHSISWAIHSKEEAKKKENRKNLKLIGNYIDAMIQEMSFGQTNGIPQGSIIMDFIAEIVLGYADELLSIELENEKINDYCILRYRDDYRIFTNNTYNIDIILKKFNTIPNTDYLNIWLQRLTILDRRDIEYQTRLCEKIYTNNNIWNSDWLNFNIDETLIVDNEKLNSLTHIITEEEVDKFFTDY